MQRYFIYLGFDGTNYHGWQIQPNGISVQECLQKGLSTLLRTETEVVGAGRTDAGVHARRMVAHFDYEGTVDVQDLAYKLNRILPRDIAVYEVRAVDNDLHARFSATSRTYHYYIHQQKDPFLRHYSCELRYPLDFEAMNEAASHLLQVEDFGAFCKSGSDVKTTLCNVTEAKWEAPSNLPLEGEAISPLAPCSLPLGPWCFVITANRFLRNMVRAVVGTLIEVGRHRMTLDEFDAVIRTGKRTEAGESMPGHALFLWNVAYLQPPSRTEFAPPLPSPKGGEKSLQGGLGEGCSNINTNK